MITLKGNPEKVLKSILSLIKTQGELIGKSKCIYNVGFSLDPTLILIDPKKNWKWAILELFDRFDPYYANPGNSYVYRPRWEMKLVKEGGSFSYTYHERFDDQFEHLYTLLKRKKNTKEAIISVWDGVYDLPSSISGDRVPCTLELHYFLDKSSKLNLTAYMRTNDVVNMLIYDIFHHAFSLLLMASRLGVKPGVYSHFSTIMYYQKKREYIGFIDRYLDNPILFDRIPYSLNLYEEFISSLYAINHEESKSFKNVFVKDFYSIVNFLLNNGEVPKYSMDFFKKAIGG